jgi:hypothetical protein
MESLLGLIGVVPLTSGESALRTWMIISAVLYALGGVSFLLGQNLLLENINGVSSLLFKDRFPLMPLATEKFWLTLTGSMMLMLVILCAYAAVDPVQYRAMVVVVLGSKAFSSGQYLYYFCKEKRYFGYIVGLLTDGPLFLVTLYFFFRA